MVLFGMVVQKFQSTLPRRERRHRPDVVGITLDISIHAPAKGATKAVLYYLILLGYFNPRSREGSDVVLVWLWCVLLYFNPRSREGSDFYVLRIFYTMHYFNPRSREGSDSNIIQQISFSLYNTVYFVSNNIK